MLITLASIRELVILENSAGCILTEPISIQELEPLVSLEMKITSTRRKNIST